MRETWGSKGTVGYERSEAPLKENRAGKSVAAPYYQIKNQTHKQKKAAIRLLFKLNTPNKNNQTESSSL